MIRRVSQFFMFGLLCLAIAACSSNPKPANGLEDPATDTGNIGNLLFTPAAWPVFDEDPAGTGMPIRVQSCLLTVLDKVEVPTKEEGAVAWLGVELKDGQAVDPQDVYEHVHLRWSMVEGKPDLTGPELRKTLTPVSEKVITKYRRLRIGERVEKGQVIALLNDVQAELEHSIAISNIEGAKKEYFAAIDAIRYYQKNVDIEVRANSSKAGIVAAKANLAKAISEKASKEWGVERAKGEERKAQEKLNFHRVRAPITGDVVTFSKQVGEGAKATESIMLLQNTDRLGVEGFLPVQYANKVAAGTEVFLEPAILDPPLSGHSPHTSSKPITAVAAIVYKDKQVIVSASEDGSVYVWDRGAVYASWPHKLPVHALACTRPDSKTQLVLTGCDDGKARLWSLAELGHEKPAVVLESHHEGGVQAAAFSPDASKCVTSDDRGEIILSDTETGKKLYSFPRMHGSTVACLHFTPQCTVISVGKDNSAIVWKMGDKSATKETSFYSSGEVTSLGVTDDGGQMVLDLDKNRLRVVDLHKTRNLGTLQQGAEGGKFAGFALISPSIGEKSGNRTILTTAVTDGILQVWRWSAGSGRGAELRKLVCTNNVPPTCAAFTPLAKDGFIIAGTRKGDVYIWPMPTVDEIANRFKATITNVAENNESNGKTVRIYAEYQNSSELNSRLRPGTTTTLVIPQK